MKVLFLLSGILLIFIFSCGKSEKQVYEEVLSTLSMYKAKSFFEIYPESQYAEQLATVIIDSCKKDKDGRCCEMALKFVPQKLKQYEDLKTLCEKSE
jgi:hypothetical protein